VAEVEKSWFAIHTYSGYENAQKESGTTDQIYGFVTRSFSIDTDGGRDRIKVGKNTPLPKNIAGYIIVEMKMTDKSWNIVRNTRR